MEDTVLLRNSLAQLKESNPAILSDNDDSTQRYLESPHHSRKHSTNQMFKSPAGNIFMQGGSKLKPIATYMGTADTDDDATYLGYDTCIKVANPISPQSRQ